MAKSESSPVFMFDGGDPELQEASEQARSQFRYFWREIVWDRQRIIPALNIACFKAPFRDRKKGSKVEQMWVGEVDFDGELVYGSLMNSPNSLKSIKQGDAVEMPLTQISDWMYTFSDEVFGAFTVQLLRRRMSAKERRDHDAAWGLNFGDAKKVRTGSEVDPHPMTKSMSPSLKEHLKKNPEAASSTAHLGWTLLHQQASIGSVGTVKILLDAGADPHAEAENGMTPLQLAETLGWDEVAKLLKRA